MFGLTTKSVLACFIGATFVSRVAAGELKIDILKAVPEADCIAAKNGDTISVHYAGTLEDGTEFDSSFSRNVPISFELGAGRVISGWEQGLVGCCIGEKRQLTIPSELGYGEYGIGPIPGGATLVFVTELVDIAGAKKPARDEL